MKKRFLFILLIIIIICVIVAILFVIHKNNKKILFEQYSLSNISGKNYGYVKNNKKSIAMHYRTHGKY